jgi:hypothetical protein
MQSAGHYVASLSVIAGKGLNIIPGRKHWARSTEYSTGNNYVHSYSLIVIDILSCTDRLTDWIQN